MNYQTISLQTVTGWAVRVLRLDISVFDEVRQERTATMWALCIVVFASLTAGFGSWLWWVLRDLGLGYDGQVFIRSFILGGLLQSLAWTLWVYIVYQVLARGYGIVLDFGALIRTMGLAFTPMVITILMLITGLAIPIALIALAGTLIMTNHAIEAASGTTGSHVIGANLAGFAVFALVMGVLANVSQVHGWGGLAPGIFFFTLA
ncbi:MAG TPA: hypothetical protein VFB90_02910 [Dehalococcoidia bacterium]|nr:hypothetical protein [Dehalococcoidia bacterium]